MSKSNRTIHLEVDGIDTLTEALANIKNLDGVKQVVREDTSELTRVMRKNEQFVRGYSIGRTKRSTSQSIYNNGLTGESGVTTEYAPFVEGGTSRMTPEPFAEPSKREMEHKFTKDIKDNIGNKK